MNSTNRQQLDNYRIRIDKFEGPLDLLLYLVKSSKINIHDISISEITKQFLQFIEHSKPLNIDGASDFIVTASILLYLKSKTLLPEEILIEEGDESEERREYIQHLIEYQTFKNVAMRLRKNIEEDDVLIRRDTQLMIDFKDQEHWEEVSIIDLITAFLRVVKKTDSSAFKTVEMEKISIDDKINQIVAYLTHEETLMFRALFPPNCSKYELIITFLALLELVKMKTIYILQHKLFGDIKLIRRKVKES